MLYIAKIFRRTEVDEMGKFEDQLKLNKTKEANLFEASATLYDNDDTEFQYDYDQVIQHLNNRFKDTAHFANRTDRYFKDTAYAKAKYNRYRNLSGDTEGEDKSASLDEYAEEYSYHSAYKRKKAAGEASDSFEKMSNAMKTLERDDASGQSLLKRYKNREKVMKYRIEGMSKAAEVKSRSSKHEKYLVSKGKLSCYMLLNEQLEALMDEARQNRDMVSYEKLAGKRGELLEKIKKETKTLRKYTPKREEIWREESKLYFDDFLKYRHDQYISITGEFGEKDAELLTNLKEYQEESEKNEWPLRTVLHDAHNRLLNRGEKDNKEWNDLYKNTKDKNALKIMEDDAIDRFKKLSIPSLKELKDPSKYVYDNLINYCELFKRALPYYKSKIGSKNYVGNYISQNKDFMAKIMLADAIDRYIDFRLRADNSIIYNKKTDVFEAESNRKYRPFLIDGKRKRNRFGEGEEKGELENLKKFYSQYNKLLSNKGESITLSNYDDMEDYDVATYNNGSFFSIDNEKVRFVHYDEEKTKNKKKNVNPELDLRIDEKRKAFKVNDENIENEVGNLKVEEQKVEEKVEVEKVEEQKVEEKIEDQKLQNKKAEDNKEEEKKEENKNAEANAGGQREEVKAENQKNIIINEKDIEVRNVVMGMAGLLKKKDVKNDVEEAAIIKTFTAIEVEEFKKNKEKEPGLTAKAYKFILEKRKADKKSGAMLPDNVSEKDLKGYMDTIEKGFDIQKMPKEGQNAGEKKKVLDKYCDEIINGNVEKFYVALNTLKMLDQLKDKDKSVKEYVNQEDVAKNLKKLDMFGKYLKGYMTLQYHINVDDSMYDEFVKKL